MPARDLLPILAALAAAAGACGGGGGSRRTIGTTFAGTSGIPADIPTMRALLERHSPSGHYIVSTYEALPARFVIGRTTITLSHSGGFADYFDDGAPENLVDQMGTAVHEVYHGYASVMGYQLQVDGKATEPVDAEAVYVGQQPMLVTYSPTYPAREMDATFPADARTSRYRTYVSPSQDSQSTQQDGVFGLLDELTAYYHTARTRLDLWPWVRDHAPPGEQLLVNYIARLHEMWVPYAEFKLFILHYLRHARDHHPEVYRGLVANGSFRRAFAAVDEAYAAVLATAGQLEPTVHAFARGRGLDAGLQGGQLTFDGSPFTIRDDAYPAVMRHLASAPYQQILAELR